jgi:hypothetical protein
MRAYLIFTLSAFFLLSSCQKDLTNTPSLPIGCTEDLSENSFSISIQDESIELPGKVSVFFKVDDKSGKPIARLKNTDFSIYEKGRNDECFKNISAFEANARISANKQIFKYSTMLVLDLSGSVLQGSFEELKSATKQFIVNIIPRDDEDAFEIGIWWFDGEDVLHELQTFTDNTALLLSKIDKMTKGMSNDPSTDLYGAVLKSAEIADRNLDSGTGIGSIAASSVVIFTDGTDQAARYTKASAIEVVKKSKVNLNYYTIGLGNEIDEDILSKIGSAGSVIADSNDDLEEKFKETADLVADEANSYYLFEYCSPKRDGSGSNEVILQVSKNGEKGYVRTQFSATGFTSGCN